MKKYISSISRIPTAILDILFPINCVGCKKEKTYCCDECMNGIPREKIIENLENGQLIAAANFKEKEILARLIHIFKYDGAVQIGDKLALLFPLKRPMEIPQNSILVPVPLHRKREYDRGYNQSLVLAHEISKKWGLEIREILLRSRDTQPQAQLSREKRLINVKDAFSLKSNSEQLDLTRPFFIVDDVCTTGTTLKECIKTLKKYGAGKVGALVIGRA